MEEGPEGKLARHLGTMIYYFLKKHWMNVVLTTPTIQNMFHHVPEIICFADKEGKNARCWYGHKGAIETVFTTSIFRNEHQKTMTESICLIYWPPGHILHYDFCAHCKT